MAKEKGEVMAAITVASQDIETRTTTEGNKGDARIICRRKERRQTHCVLLMSGRRVQVTRLPQEEEDQVGKESEDKEVSNAGRQ